MNKGSIAHFAVHYTKRLLLSLVPIPKGMKGPRTSGWNLPENTVQDEKKAERVFSRSQNMGVLHSASDTGTLDIDHREWAAQALAAIGYDLAALEQWPVRIKGRANEKPFFQMGGRKFERRALAWPHPTEKIKDKDGNPTDRPVMVTLFELRSGAVQDVLPPSIHPDTGLPYEWVGVKPRCRADIPMISEELVRLWEEWDTLVKAMQAACPWASEEKGDQHGKKSNGHNDGHNDKRLTNHCVHPQSAAEKQRPGDVFKAQVSPREILERNGYQPRGDRYVPPGSKSAAGVRILVGDDGIARAYSDHGSCALGNGHAHDSFSCLAVLEHGGDFKAAARAAAAELGLERSVPAISSQEPRQPTPQELWEQHAQGVFDELISRLGAAGGHTRSRQKYMDAITALWAAVANGCLVVRNGQPRIEFGGLEALAEAMLYQGRRHDVRLALDYLTTLGMIGKVVYTTPGDRFSPLAVEVPADPRHLPALRFQGTLKLKSTSWTTIKRLDGKNKNGHNDGHNDKRLTNHCVHRSPRPENPLHDARWTLYWIRRGAGSVAEVARLSRVRIATVKKHLAALEAAGMVVDFQVSVTETEARQIIRAEVESNPSYRASRVRYLEAAAHFGNRGATIAAHLGAPQLQKRRTATANRAIDRLNRLADGESCGAVFGVAV